MSMAPAPIPPPCLSRSEGRPGLRLVQVDHKRAKARSAEHSRPVRRQHRPKVDVRPTLRALYPHNIERPCPMTSDFSPDWRWEIAKSLATCPRLPRWVAKRDPLLAEASRFIRELMRPDLADEEESIRDRWPSISDVRSINNDERSRWLLRSLVLANVAPEQIVLMVPISLEVLECFERLCFDMRDLLKYPVYMTNFLRPWRKATGEDAEFRRQAALAYHLGKADLDFAMDPTAELSISADRKIQNMLTNQIQNNALDAARAMPASTKGGAKAIRLYMRSKIEPPAVRLKRDFDFRQGVMTAYQTITGIDFRFSDDDQREIMSGVGPSIDERYCARYYDAHRRHLDAAGDNADDTGVGGKPLNPINQYIFEQVESLLSKPGTPLAVAAMGAPELGTSTTPRNPASPDAQVNRTGALHDDAQSESQP